MNSKLAVKKYVDPVLRVLAGPKPLDKYEIAERMSEILGERIHVLRIDSTLYSLRESGLVASVKIAGTNYWQLAAHASVAA